MSLRELQSRFVAALEAPRSRDDASPRSHRLDRIAIYRNTIAANYRNALAATYPVVRALVGAPFFNAAGDAYVRSHPSRSGDLNCFGDAFADFVGTYAHARELPYLADVARLEWAIDEAGRAADAPAKQEDLPSALARVPADALGVLRLTLDPSMRLIDSAYPVFTIWRIHQTTVEGEQDVGFGRGREHLLVLRSANGVAVERIDAAEAAWLAALQEGKNLAHALETAVAVDATFDLTRALEARIADGTLVSLRA